MIEQLKIYWSEKKYRIFFAAILLAALAMRLLMFFGPMEYDEIWTIGYIGNSVGKILTDLATPNNHPLNTLFVKLWRNCFDIVQLIRLHSLVFGMLSVVLTGMLARALFRSRVPALLSMLFMAFDAAAIYYSDQARGYAAQLFFLLAFANGLVWSGRLRKFLPWKYLPEAAVIVGALGAVLSVPSAPIFLAATVIAARVGRRKLPDGSMLISVGIAAALVAAYLGFNQSDLRAAQAEFGQRLASGDDWIGFLIMIAQDFFPLATAPFLLVIAATDRKRGLILLVCAAVIVLSPALAGAGPSRVYLPLCAVVALGAGRGAHALLTAALVRDNLRLVRILAATTVFLAGFGYFQLYDTWHITDYYGWLNTGESMPPTYLIVYPATKGYPLWWNSDRKKLQQDLEVRMTFDGTGKRRLLCFGIEPGHINGANPRKSSMPQEDRALAVKGTPKTMNGFPTVEYELYPAEPRPGDAFIAVLPFHNGARATVKALHGAGCDLLVLNPHFPTVMIYGKAPENAQPELWRYVRYCGSKLYTFTPGGTGKKASDIHDPQPGR